MRRNVALIAVLVFLALCMGFVVGANSARTASPLPDETSYPSSKASDAAEKPRRAIPAVVTPSAEEDADNPGETEGYQGAELDGGDARLDTSAYSTWSEEECPNYYRIVGEATIDSDLQPGEVTYSGLDHLGRSGRAMACVTYDLMTEGIARNRDDMSSIEPSGWGHNEEVDIKLADGSYYHGYLYNRSHLIAKSLGGSDIRENLVTGTRMQNVGANNPAGGMLFCEQTVRNWLEGNPDGWVLYAATPIYEEDELVCRSVIVDMISSDRSLNMQVEVYNAALGFEIDYATGKFTAIGQ